MAMFTGLDHLHHHVWRGKIISKRTFRWQEEFRLVADKKSDGVHILAVPERANI
ncbi:hypothetical protein [Mesorhizobium caraganae]|uniref:hypothetical protein n=1 Tax=Mesorhizobium caraganae TaxID=483206 RepID=UPI00333DFC38